MEIKFLGQPSQLQFGSLIHDLLARASDGHFIEFHIASAFAKKAGVARIEAAIRKAKEAAKVKVFAYIGVDHEGTSREAIKLLSEICDRLVIVFSTRPDVTFHSKVYFCEGVKYSAAIVGSSNLTAGGLYTNIETGIFLDKIEAGSDTCKDIQAYLKHLGDTSLPFIEEVTDKNITEILSYLPTEAISWKKSVVAAQTGAGEPKPKTIHSLFGPGRFPKAPLLPGDKEVLGGAESSIEVETNEVVENLPAPPAVAQALAPLTEAQLGIIRGFWKQLSPWDTRADSAPGQMQIPKQFAPLFPALGNDIHTPIGAVQSDVTLAVRFIGLGITGVRPNSRFIKYEPAAHHERPNIEHRFTFLDRAINPDGLKSGDILVFEILANDAEGCWFNSYHVPQSDPLHATIRAMSKRTYGSLPN